MKNIAPFKVATTENHLGLTPSTIHYKITDDEFIKLANDVVFNSFGTSNYDFRLHSGTDNMLQIYNTGDLINKIYKDKLTRNHELHSSYYVLKYILDSLFEEGYVAQCSTSYRGQNRMYVEIYVSYMTNQSKETIKSFDDYSREKYTKTIRQIEMLESKIEEIFNNNNKNGQI